MNKIPLLEKFAAQSLVYVDTGLDDGKELVFSKEKFAELIVQECATAIIQDGRLNDVRSAANGCVRTIREHFGVEE